MHPLARAAGVLVLAALAAVATGAETTPGVAPAPQLPPAASAALEAFRKVPWDERVKPVRGDPIPDGWQDRLRAEWALAALDASAWPALDALLADENRHVRALAAKALGLTGHPTRAPALIAALGREKDKLVRLALVEALGRTGGVGAVEAVESQQGGGTDPDVSFTVGMARRQLKGAHWDVANLRAEFLEAARTTIGAAQRGQPAPELSLPSADRPVNLSTFLDKVVVLAFTHGDRGTTCGKVLERLWSEDERLARLDVVVVVVDPHEKERTAAWRDRLKLPFVFASDPAGRAQGAYGVARQLVVGGEWLPSPAWFVIDRKGKLVWSKVGRRPDEHASLGDLLPVLENVSRGIVVK